MKCEHAYLESGGDAWMLSSFVDVIELVAYSIEQFYNRSLGIVCVVRGWCAIEVSCSQDFWAPRPGSGSWTTTSSPELVSFSVVPPKRPALTGVSIG